MRPLQLPDAIAVEMAYMVAIFSTCIKGTISLFESPHEYAHFSLTTMHHHNASAIQESGKLSPHPANTNVLGLCITTGWQWGNLEIGLKVIYMQYFKCGVFVLARNRPIGGQNTSPHSCS